MGIWVPREFQSEVLESIRNLDIDPNNIPVPIFFRNTFPNREELFQLAQGKTYPVLEWSDHPLTEPYDFIDKILTYGIERNHKRAQVH